jgi:hypothetical protein
MRIRHLAPVVEADGGSPEGIDAGAPADAGSPPSPEAGGCDCAQSVPAGLLAALATLRRRRADARILRR